MRTRCSYIRTKHISIHMEHICIRTKPTLLYISQPRIYIYANTNLFILIPKSLPVTGTKTTERHYLQSIKDEQKGKEHVTNDFLKYNLHVIGEMLVTGLVLRRHATDTLVMTCAASFCSSHLAALATHTTLNVHRSLPPLVR